jgi:hypothetical protein
LEALAVPGGSEKPGPDWKSRADLEILIGMKRFALQNFLSKGIQRGAIEMKKFRVRRSDGVFQQVPHYRLVK